MGTYGLSKREIKFRAWHTKHKMMYRQDVSMGIDFKFTPYDLSLSEREYPWTGRYDRDLIKMQYTGLTDKNGKEIYEGDIVTDGIFIAEIAWGIGHAGFIFTGGKHSMEMCKGVFELELKRCELIGNVFENPELLEATHETLG